MVAHEGSGGALSITDMGRDAIRGMMHRSKCENVAHRVNLSVAIPQLSLGVREQPGC